MSYFGQIYMTDSASISRRVQSFLIQQPSIRETLRLGIINYSALARLICNDLGVEEEVAVQKALQRMQQRISSSSKDSALFPKILRKAKLVVKNQMATVALRRPTTAKQLASLTSFGRDDDESEITIVEGHMMASLIVPEESLKDCQQLFKSRIQAIERDLVKLTLLFEPRVIRLIGFAGYVHGLFGAHKVNIYGEATCAGEHIIMIKTHDLPAAMALLR